MKQGRILSMGCKGCHKFYNKVFCYSDCNNKDSHCKLIGNDKEKFDERIKQMRGEWVFGQGHSDVLQFKKKPDKKFILSDTQIEKIADELKGDYSENISPN